MIGNIKVEFAPDGQVLEIALPKTIVGLPIQQRKELYCEVAYMLEGLQNETDEHGPVHTIGGYAGD